MYVGIVFLHSFCPFSVRHAGWWDVASARSVIAPLQSAVSSALNQQGIGLYPKGYEAKVHGPYYPWVWYGKQDTKLADVKLGELPQWFGRRDPNPVAWIREGRRRWYFVLYGHGK